MKRRWGSPRTFRRTSSRRACAAAAIDQPAADRREASSSDQSNVEQATYLEWSNSKFQTEYRRRRTGARARTATCRRAERRRSLWSRIRAIPRRRPGVARRRQVRSRASGFRRHELLGLNALSLSMFREFPEVTRVRTVDFMSGEVRRHRPRDREHRSTGAARDGDGRGASARRRRSPDRRRRGRQPDRPSTFPMRRLQARLPDVEVRDSTSAPDAARISHRSHGSARKDLGTTVFRFAARVLPRTSGIGRHTRTLRRSPPDNERQSGAHLRGASQDARAGDSRPAFGGAIARRRIIVFCRWAGRVRPRA